MGSATARPAQPLLERNQQTLKRLVLFEPWLTVKPRCVVE